jgi:hypothetical protein
MLSSFPFPEGLHAAYTLAAANLALIFDRHGLKPGLLRAQNCFQDAPKK